MSNINGNIEHDEEGRTFYVDPNTGARKEVKLDRFDLIPPEAMFALARHFGVGALKYADRNWEKGYPVSVSVAALERHLQLWKMGEDIDPEGFPHLAAVMWHAAVIYTLTLRFPDLDDRPDKGGTRAAWMRAAFEGQS